MWILNVGLLGGNSRMSESGMRSNLVKALKPLDAVPIENQLRSGHPDINCIGADIECKWKKFWPKTCYTKPVRFDHPLSKEQGIWLNRRWLKGGLTLVAAQVSRQWFFFGGDVAKDVFGNLTRPEMEEIALLYFKKGLEKERLIEWIKFNSH